MSRKDVNSRLFVVDPSRALLGGGLTASSLVPGQIGIFDASNGKSLVPQAVKASNIAFYFGMGLGTGNILEDVIYSPEIQTTAPINVDFNCATQYVAPIKAIKDLNPSCDTSYSISVIVRTDISKSWVGARPIIKSFPVLTACCDDLCACGGGNCNDLAVRYARAVMSDADALVKCWLVPNADASTNTDPANGIDPFDQAAIDAAITAGGDGFCFAIQFSPNLEGVYRYCEIMYKTTGGNWDNAGLPAFTFDLAATVGHNCMGTIIDVQDAVYPSMTLADVQLQEYFQQAYIGGLEHGPYRVLDGGQPLTGSYKIQPKLGATTFSVLSILAKNTNHIGQNDRDHYVDVQFAIPCPGTGSAITGVITPIVNFLKDSLHTGVQFNPTTSDVAAALTNCDCVS